VILVLFVAHVLSPSTYVRYLFAGAYIGMALLLLLVKGERRRTLVDLLRSRGRLVRPALGGKAPGEEDEREEAGP
jgi:hypothetical protein